MTAMKKKNKKHEYRSSVGQSFGMNEISETQSVSSNPV